MASSETQVSGHKELFYTVRKGDTLGGIAQSYRGKGWPVRGWEPIYDITRLKTGLWGRKGAAKQRYNPDLIYPGDVVLLPRSAAGYDKRIQQMEWVGEMIRTSDDEAASIRKQADNFAERLDTLGSLLQAVVTFGGSAVRAAAAAKTARTATGEALEKAMKEHHKEMAELYLSGATLSAGEAAKLHDKQSKKLETGIKAPKGVYKTIDMIYDRVRAAAKGVKRVGLTVATGLDVILDFVDPSTVAKAYIYLRTGEKVDDTLLKAELAGIQQRDAALKQIGDRVAALRAEKAYLYGGGPVPQRPN